MHGPVSRREALRAATGVGAGALLTSAKALARGQLLEIAGKPVELCVTPATPQTVRISVQPIENGRAVAVPRDGALVREDFGKPAAVVRVLAASRIVRCGTLTVRLTPGDTLSMRITRQDGRTIQQLQLDARTGRLAFQAGEGPVLGLGAGGPQFDKRGAVDRMRSGQGGFRLATHGGKAPVQLAIGTSGWALFIHQPLGAFDLTGTDGVFAAAGADSALPLDVFVIGASEPAAVMREYSKITGFPEMVPLWSFGYQQSHRTLDSPEQILEEARAFREKKLPCDTMIYSGRTFVRTAGTRTTGSSSGTPTHSPTPNPWFNSCTI